jgi:DNA processing protein
MLRRSDGTGLCASRGSGLRESGAAMDLLDAVALSAVSGIARPRAFAACKELIDAGHDPSLEEVIACCSSDGSAGALAADARRQAEVLLGAARAERIEVIRAASKMYPPLLGTITDPPPILWARGQLDALLRPAVAIVGSRAASTYALEVAARLASDLAGRGIVVVSGLARGVDGAAHRGCLDGCGATVAVLGSGVNRIYPAEHDDLAARICTTGAIVSEHGPGVAPLPEHFPLRNRLISGISLGVVVVEANERSGSLITARCALDQGRDVMAVPGSVLGGRNRGSHALLKDGAKVVETADDILEELGWRAASPAVTGPARQTEISANSLTTDDLLLKLTPGEAYDLDQMSATVGLTGSTLLARLTQWEMRGELKKVAGGRYVVAGKN